MRANRRLLVGAAMVSLLLGSCHPRLIGRPAWVVSHQHPAYAPSAYLIGTGQGSTRKQAVEHARKDLLTRTRSALKASFASAVAKWADATPVRLITPESSVALCDSSCTPPAVVDWKSSDGRNHAVLVAISREERANATRTQLKTLGQQCRELLQVVDELAVDSPYPALLNSLATFGLRSEIEHQRVLLSFLTGQALVDSDSPRVEDLETVLKRLLQSLQIYSAVPPERKILAGQSWQMTAGVDQVKADQRNPVEGIPLRFESGASAQLQQETVKTDEAGMATARLTAASGETGESPGVLVRLDGTRILTEAGLPANDARFTGLIALLESRQLAFHPFVRDAATQRVALLIVCQGLPEETPESGLAPVLSRELLAAHLDVMDAEAFVGPDAVQTEANSLARDLAGKSDWLIVGWVKAEPGSQVSQGFVFSEVKSELRLIRIADGQAWPFAQHLRGAGRSPSQAVERLMARLGREAFAVFKDHLLSLDGDRTSKASTVD